MIELFFGGGVATDEQIAAEISSQSLEKGGHVVCGGSSHLELSCISDVE